MTAGSPRPDLAPPGSLAEAGRKQTAPSGHQTGFIRARPPHSASVGSGPGPIGAAPGDRTRGPGITLMASPQVPGVERAGGPFIGHHGAAVNPRTSFAPGQQWSPRPVPPAQRPLGLPVAPSGRPKGAGWRRPDNRDAAGGRTVGRGTAAPAGGPAGAGPGLGGTPAFALALMAPVAAAAKAAAPAWRAPQDQRR